MKHAVVLAHPNHRSFNHAVAHRYCERVRALGHEVLMRDLYAIGFDPRLHMGEIPWPGGFAPDSDVVHERRLLDDVDVFVFVHPLWFYDRPAILKGYVDRVFGMGFGYGPITGGANSQLLEGRRLLTFSSSGAPNEWLEEEGAWPAIRAVLDTHFARVCGLQVLDHVHFGAIVPNMAEHAFDEAMGLVDKAAERLFSPELAA